MRHLWKSFSDFHEVSRTRRSFRTLISGKSFADHGTHSSGMTPRRGIRAVPPVGRVVRDVDVEAGVAQDERLVAELPAAASAGGAFAHDRGVSPVLELSGEELGGGDPPARARPASPPENVVRPRPSPTRTLDPLALSVKTANPPPTPPTNSFVEVSENSPSLGAESASKRETSAGSARA